MVNDGLALSHPATRSWLPSWVAEAGFVVFILLIFVGLSPFAVVVPNAVTKATGQGDALRQLSYLFAFGLVAVAAYERRALNALSAVPISIALLLAWCFVSAAWAHEPSVTMRRTILEAIVVLSVMFSVDTIGAERALRLWSYVLVLILVINWISIPLVPQAVHLASEGKPQLVGDWRGLYQQKNTAGAVSAVTALIFLYYFLRQRNWIDLAVLLAALGFLAMTRSKTSIGLLPVAMVSAAAYRLAWRRDMDRWFVALGGLLIVAVGVILGTVYWDRIVHTLSDPDALTGRTMIWHAVWGYIHDHPLLGSGYGALSDTGATSPLSKYIQSQWIIDVYDSHSGYLQLLATIGIPGFVLAMVALVVVPLVDFWRRDPANLALKALLFGFFIFWVLHNFLEAEYLASDDLGWVSFLLVLAMLRSMRARPAEGAI